ncbi:hypothetical protein ACNQGC_01590 [Flavobacterium sp. GSP11]|uniref:hypothetical protein n=1 Tax=Flavobacterium sp. GSP11 TaxID=3401730 RepID=UPI003AACEEC7
MKSIQLKNIKVDEIEVLREQIIYFINDKSEALKSMNKDNADFYVSYILIDVLMRLTLKLRNRMEQSFKKTFSIRLTISEASALFLLCIQEVSFLTDYQKHVLLKTRNNIDQQLTNLN